jgi:microcystin-dependent protein
MITNTNARVTYNLSTTGATYSSNFKVFSKSEVEVKVVRTTDNAEVVLTVDSDFTIDTLLIEAGSNFDLSLYETANNITDWTSYDSGNWQLSITRKMSPTQETDYNPNDDFPAETHENALDKLTALIQDIGTGLLGSFTNPLQTRFPDNEPSATSGILPAFADRLGKLAGWDSITGEWEAVDLDPSTVGGMSGPTTQTDGRVAFFSAVNGVLKEVAGVDSSLWETQTLVYGATVAWDSSNGHTATLNLSGDATLNVSNIKAGEYNLIVTQDGTGGHTITFGTGFSAADNVQINTDASAISIVKLVSDGTSVYPVGSSQSAASVAGSVGTIQWFMYNISSTEDEVGYLICNGQAVSRNKYADLFAKIGTTYGIGDGSTTFNVPDLTTDGRFIRASLTAGTQQADQFAEHNHQVKSDLLGVPEMSHTHSGSDSAGDTFTTGAVDPGSTTQLPDGNFNQGTDVLGTTENSGSGTETRPVNISAIPGIKF